MAVDDAEKIAQQFHEHYERLAPSFGYKTREESAVPWSDVPDRNKQLMIEVVDTLLVTGGIVSASEHKHLRAEVMLAAGTLAKVREAWLEAAQSMGLVGL